MAVPDDGVDEPLSVAEILRREGLSVPHSAGGALVPRRHQRALITPPPEPGMSRKALAVTGSLLVVGAVFGASVLDEAVSGHGFDSGSASALAATPAGPAVPAQRGAALAHTVDLAELGGEGAWAQTVPAPAAWRMPGSATGTTPGTGPFDTQAGVGTPGGTAPGGSAPGGGTPGGGTGGGGTGTPGGGTGGGGTGGGSGGGGGLPGGSVGTPSVPVGVPPVELPVGGTTPVGVTLPGVGVGGGSSPSVSTSPAGVTTPEVHTAPIQAGPVSTSSGSAKLPDVGVSGAQVAVGGGGAQATLPSATVSKAEVALPSASVAGVTVDAPKVSTPPVQVPATSLITNEPAKTVQSVGSTATGVLDGLVGGK